MATIIDTSQNYGYFKIAKMNVDSSSNLTINALVNKLALTTVDLSANTVITDTLKWNNAYIPDPSNYNSVYLPTTTPYNKGNTKFNSMDTVKGTSTFTGASIISSLDVSGSLITTNVTVSGATLINGDVSCNSITASSLSTNGLTANTLNTVFFNVDSSGTVSSNQMNVVGNTNLNYTYVSSDLTSNSNGSVSENLAIIKNKYIGNSLFVNNVFQMWDASGHTDASGFSNIVNITGNQLYQLLHLVDPSGYPF